MIMDDQRLNSTMTTSHHSAIRFCCPIVVDPHLQDSTAELFLLLTYFRAFNFDLCFHVCKYTKALFCVSVGAHLSQFQDM